MFTIVAERINMTRKRVREEAWQRNAAFIQAEVAAQEKAGATHIDLNAGADPAREVEDMKWLVETARSATSLPLSYDSANAQALRSALGLENRPGTIVNSITGEKGRVEAILPLVTEFGTGVVALTMDDRGMPETLEQRMEAAEALMKGLSGAGVAEERVYFDPLVRPVSTNPDQACVLIRTVGEIKQRWPAAHVIVGLSNVSFGLPRRNLLNRAFLTLLVEAGLDGAIIDPTEPGMMGTLHATRAVLGQDEFCMEYITAEREGRLG